MTPDCLRLDDYLDGRLSESESETFESHTVTCAECDAALDGALEIPGLAALRDETCPPAVVTAALRLARRAPDRAAVPSARRSSSRLSLVVLALAAAVALIIGLTRLAAPDVPTVAQTDLPATTVDPMPEVVPPESTTLAETALPEIAAPAPAVTPTPPVQTAVVPRTPAPAPSPREVTAVPDDALAQADATPDPDESPDATPTADEIAGAQRDLALAFSLIAHAQTQAGEALRSRAGPVSATLDQALPF